MTDSEKHSMVAAGLLTGALSPSIFAGASKLFKMKPETIARVKELAKIEKMFGQRGLLTLGELLDHRGVKKFEAAMDNIPLPAFGLSGKRKDQFLRFQQMVGSIVDRIHGARNLSVGERAAQRSANLNQMVDGTIRRFNRFKVKVDRSYDNVAKELDRIRENPNLPPALQSLIPKVRLGNMQNAARELLKIEKAKSKGVQNAEAISSLQKFLEDKTLTFQGARDTLSDLKELVRVERVSSAQGTATKKELRALVKLEMGLHEDMSLFGDALEKAGAPNVSKMLNDANKQFKDLILPFYEAPVVQDIVGGSFNRAMDLDAVASAFINASRPERTRATQRLLTASDRDVAKHMVLREALDRSNRGRSDIFINPKTFADELADLQQVWGISFSAKEQDMIQGFVTLVDMAPRAFSGASALGPLMAAGGVAAATGANKAAGNTSKFLASLLGMKWMFGTKTGRTILGDIKAAGNDQKALVEAAKLAELGFTRWLESNLPEMVGPKAPELGGFNR
jgi:hypothetical protein